MKTVPYEIQAKDARLGDVVQLSPQPFNHATIVAITETGVKVCRPYVHTSDFTYTGGVLRYLGWEEFDLYPTTTVLIIQESTVDEVINTETDPERLERSGIAERRRRGTDRPEYRAKWQKVSV